MTTALQPVIQLDDAASTTDNAATMLRSIDLTSVLAEYDESTRDNLKWLAEQIIDNDWSFSTAAAHSGLAASTLSRVFKGSYGARLERFGERLAQYRALVEDRAGVANPDFCETRAAKDLFAVCRNTAAARTVSLVYGPMGWGKTTILSEFARRNNHGRTIYLRCPAALPLNGFLRHFVSTLGRSPNLGGLMDYREAIFRKLQGRATLLIVDELHEPFLTSRQDTCVRICEFLREIHDVCRIGLVLCGTDALPDEMRNGKFAKGLQQLIDRGNLEYVIPKRLTDADKRMFFRHYGLPDAPTAEAASIIRDTLKIHSLRRLIFLLQDGGRLAAHRGEPYHWSHFVTAHNILVELRNPGKED
jgi:DNA transposition AAA+ family ATPase